MKILLYDMEPRTCPAELLRSPEREILRAESQDDALRLTARGGIGLAVVSARIRWTDCAALLRALEKRSLPVLFVADSLRHAAHLQTIYRGPSRVVAPQYGREALLRAVAELTGDTEPPLIVGSLRLDPGSREVSFAGRMLALTAQEFALLRALMESPFRPVPREELLRSAWGYLSPGMTRTVDVHIQRLRRKIGADAIETVYRQGYRLRVAS